MVKSRTRQVIIDTSFNFDNPSTGYYFVKLSWKKVLKTISPKEKSFSVVIRVNSLRQTLTIIGFLRPTNQGLNELLFSHATLTRQIDSMNSKSNLGF